MGFLRNLKLWLHPPRMSDPDFGTLVFMHSSKAPERSYREGESNFPNTGTLVFISLRGDESGPTLDAKRFYLGLPDRFEQILATCRPKLEKFFEDWLGQPLPPNIFSALKLSGFDVEDLSQRPIHWDVSLEATGDKWLGITVPFVGETATEAWVDTCG